jgi:hypothetical protein
MRLHIHFHREVRRDRLYMKWRIVERCRCGKERVRFESVRFADATDEEKAAESPKSKALRLLGM